MKTKDLTIFKIHESNRPINNAKVNRLVKSMQTIGFEEVNAIEVNPDMYVTDGQHRLEAAKILRIPVYYFITNRRYEDTVIYLNRCQSSWSLFEYVHFYASMGNKNYKGLLDFEDKYKFGAAISLYCYAGAVNANTIRSGSEFKINDRADEIANYIIECKKIIPYGTKRNFAYAVCNLFKVANEKQILKVKAKLISVPELASVNSYLTAFQNIINKNVHVSNHITLLTSKY